MASATTLSDGYDAWYAEKIWRLLPAVYRTLDVGSQPGGPGPLREMVNRIGAQVAVLRRSIDRLWENESIETCDDWVIPYIGDLLATRIISFVDTRAQRLDVAHTIFYRRRAGTLGLLEQLAADVAARDAHVVEFFRRLGRTRHQLDPQVSLGARLPKTFDPTVLEQLPIPMVEGLVGRYSRTPAGGYADLRNAYGADNAGTAFDEFSYTADFRRGAQSFGRYNISHLGAFVWWLRSFPIVFATACAGDTCPDHFTFDPTGRLTPLFALASRTSPGSFGENWVTPDEWELPVAIRQVLFKTAPDRLYPASLSVSLSGGGATTTVSRQELVIHPEIGLASFVAGAPAGTSVVSSYHFGFGSTIGAGAFDESVFLPPLEPPAPNTRLSVSGGAGPTNPLLAGTTQLDFALSAASGTTSGSVTIAIEDSLTYPPARIPNLTVNQGVTVSVMSESPQRPVLRWPGAAAAEWHVQGGTGGNGTASVLVLQGILVQGADVVLTGNFDTVRLRLVTLDPGTSSNSNVTPPNHRKDLEASPPPPFGIAIDGTPLRPSTLFIEGVVGHLIIERSITGPIRTRNGGAVAQLTASDSIIQSIATHAPGAGPLLDPTDLATRLKSAPPSDTLAHQIIAASSNLAVDLAGYASGTAVSTQLLNDLKAALQALAASGPQIEARFPLAFAALALGFSSGTTSLSRCTVLGKGQVHRLEASESILDDVIAIEDAQHGCVRFTAYAAGTEAHQPFRSVEVPPVGPLFLTRNFGDPEYARLRRDADAAILSAQPGDLVSSGAQNGSEMGAFSLEGITPKRRGLALKFLEFIPLGIFPVWIDAD